MKLDRLVGQNKNFQKTIAKSLLTSVFFDKVIMFSGRPLKFPKFKVFYQNANSSLKKNAIFIMILLNKSPDYGF